MGERGNQSRQHLPEGANLSEPLQLTQNGSVVLDGSGNGRISLGPSVVRESWTPTSAVVAVSTTTLEARCDLYLGVGGNPARLLASSRTGSSGDTCGFGGFTLMPGQSVVAVWTGGDAGATATLNVYGTRQRGGS